MPEIKSYADLIRDWVKLLAACRDNAAILGSIEPLRFVLEGLLAQNQEVKSRQDALAAQKQAATQELDALKEEGREAARRLRGAVKSLLGSRSELLGAFQRGPPAQARPPQGPREAAGAPGPGRPVASGGDRRPHRVAHPQDLTQGGGASAPPPFLSLGAPASLPAHRTLPNKQHRSLKTESDGGLTPTSSAAPPGALYPCPGDAGPWEY